ncbi:hypothetical protein [Streptomyces sp. NPDC046942]|uniref:hypothetical protein n=1 Tax=Streptomyces sp. NPDC046942 TaxID=3155137 RepID=UPI0033E7D607
MRPHRPVPHAGRKRATATAAARTLGLGAQEKLVVKDVVDVHQVGRREQGAEDPIGCKATLTFWLHIDTAESGSTAYDKLTVSAGSTTLTTG